MFMLGEDHEKQIEALGKNICRSSMLAASLVLGTFGASFDASLPARIILSVAGFAVGVGVGFYGSMLLILATSWPLGLAFDALDGAMRLSTFDAKPRGCLRLLTPLSWLFKVAVLIVLCWLAWKGWPWVLPKLAALAVACLVSDVAGVLIAAMTLALLAVGLRMQSRL